MGGRIWRLGFGLLLVAVPVASCSESSDEGAKPAREAPRLDSFSLTDLDGAPLQWESGTGRLTANGEETSPAALFVHVFQPDCGKCEELARALDPVASDSPRVAAVGIAHRQGEPQTRDLVQRASVRYPVAVGTGGAWTKRWSRGDPLYVVDAGGRIVYRQTGFREDDVARWKAVAEDLVAGRTPRYGSARREDLEAGDPLPRIELPDLFTKRPISLSSAKGKLEFRDADGETHRYRASIGFFSRY